MINVTMSKSVISKLFRTRIIPAVALTYAGNSYITSCDSPVTTGQGVRIIVRYSSSYFIIEKVYLERNNIVLLIIIDYIYL